MPSHQHIHESYPKKIEKSHPRSHFSDELKLSILFLSSFLGWLMTDVCISHTCLCQLEHRVYTGVLRKCALITWFWYVRQWTKRAYNPRWITLYLLTMLSRQCHSRAAPQRGRIAQKWGQITSDGQSSMKNLRHRACLSPLNFTNRSKTVSQPPAHHTTHRPATKPSSIALDPVRSQSNAPVAILTRLLKPFQISRAPKTRKYKVEKSSVDRSDRW